MDRQLHSDFLFTAVLWRETVRKQSLVTNYRGLHVLRVLRVFGRLGGRHEATVSYVSGTGVTMLPPMFLIETRVMDDMCSVVNVVQFGVGNLRLSVPWQTKSRHKI